jgi:AAA ATPase domain
MHRYDATLYRHIKSYTSLMDARRNPYAPGAGRPPAALVGRDLQRESWEIALDRIGQARDAQSVALYGLRGVGKTVLLTTFAGMARDRGWLVAQVEAGSGRSLREAVGEALHAPLTDLVRPSAGQRLLKALKTARSFKTSYDAAGSWNFGIDLSAAAGGGADTGVLETDLTKLVNDLTAVAGDDGVGLTILIDEAQDLDAAELIAICSVAHTAAQQRWPLVIALAGLPSLPRVLAEAKSYAERLFLYERIEHLPYDAAREAILRPAIDERIDWEDEAVDLIVSQAMGYPYFLQQFGQDTWNVAERAPISLADARVGTERGWAALDNGFFRVRWDRATRGEQQYLRAMAQDGDSPSASGEVAGRLNRKQTGLGPVRAKLISKGLIYAPEHGMVQFTVPGMADFINRQAAG